MPALAGLSPHLRLQSDERLVALVRRGHHGAFETLVKRYHARLLAFCRHMVGSNEDAEDVLQEVFASAYNAICADDRPIKARPWLYRIARNRCLNQLRRPQDAGQESMDVFEREEGATAADTVHRREEFRHLVADVQELAESQRTALLLREIHALSYDQIADAMETTVPSVKSLLVRARVSLAEAAEARQLTCAEVRLELGQAAEGIAKPSSAARRHARACPRCKTFKRELRRTSGVLAAVLPVGAAGPEPAILSELGAGSAVPAAAGGSAATGAAILGGGAAGVVSAGAGSLFAKAAAGLVAAALVTAGAAGVQRGNGDRGAGQAPPASVVEGAPGGHSSHVRPPLAPRVSQRKRQPAAGRPVAARSEPWPAAAAATGTAPGAAQESGGQALRDGARHHRTAVQSADAEGVRPVHGAQSSRSEPDASGDAGSSAGSPHGLVDPAEAPVRAVVPEPPSGEGAAGPEGGASSQGSESPSSQESESPSAPTSPRPEGSHEGGG